MKPLYITISGPDGCGKSTLLQSLKNYFANSGTETMVISMLGPGLLRETVLNDNHLLPVERMTLMRVAAERAYREVGQALQSGCTVLSDRGIDCYYAYQGYGHGLLEQIEKLNEFFPVPFLPDLTFLLDAPVSVCRERITSRDSIGDVFEAEKDAFFEKVREGYLARMAEDADKQQPRIKLLDATGSQKAVAMEATLHLDWVIESLNSSPT